VRPLCSISSQPSSISMFGRAVLAHRDQLDQVDLRVDLGDREQQVEVCDHVVLLSVDGVLAVDHRVRRGALLGEVDHRVGRKSLMMWYVKIASVRSPM